MASLHVLERSGNGWRVAIHVTVPVANNSIGISWSALLLKSGIGGATVLKDGTGSDGGISSVEKASIVAGTVLEVVDTIAPPADATTQAAVNAWLDAYKAQKTAEVIASIQQALQQYGWTRP